MWPAFRDALRTLHPAYFAFVMSTGIISLAGHLQGLTEVAIPLYWLNLAAYLLLWGLYICRVVLFGGEVRRDLSDHGRGPGFFTMVAGSGVLGSQALLIGGNLPLASTLWVITLSLWVYLTYAILAVLITKKEKPTLAQGINGGWLLAVVASQAVSVLSSRLPPYYPAWGNPLLLLALVTWLWGGMLYVWISSLIFYRILFLPLSPQDLTPPYWICMGAVAISTLAGTGLIAQAGPHAFLHAMLPFLKGFTFFFWAVATGWIPLLVILFLWRHLIRRISLSYTPLFWGAVFPLGMYTACTYRLGEETGLALIMSIPKGCFYVALGAWLAAFAGLARSMAEALRRCR
ncbi:MAG: tellurite resistance/C4-dicarboxylate transporter family protein [Thermodesulfobacteriota bacterium]